MASPLCRDDGLVSPLPPDGQLQRYCGAYLYSWLFSGGAAGSARQLKDAIPAERVAADAVALEEPYVPEEPTVRGIGAQPEHVLEEACHGREATPAHEVVFGAVAWGGLLRGVVLPERSGLFEDPHHVVYIFAGDLMRQV